MYIFFLWDVVSRIAFEQCKWTLRCKESIISQTKYYVFRKGICTTGARIKKDPISKMSIKLMLIHLKVN